MKKIFIIILLLIILLLTIYLKRCNNNIENFEEKLDYSINSRIGGKKAFIYNINKITQLPNNIGNALKLNGSSSYIYVPDIGFDKYTISFLLKFGELQYDQIIMSPSNDGESKTWNLVLQGGKLVLKINTLNEVKILESSRVLNLNEWYHCALIYDGNSYTLFVNGNQNKVDIKENSKLDNLVVGTGKEKKTFLNAFIGDINIGDEVYDKEELCNVYNLCGDTKSILEQDNQDQVEGREKIKDTDASQVCFTPPKVEKKCEFLAHGESKISCVKKCVNDSGCLPTECKNICDSCNDEKFCKWIKVTVPECKFIPYGSSLFNCINKCTLESGCDYLKCQNICEGCMDHDSCPWIKEVEVKKEPEEDDIPIQPPPVFDEKGRPMPPKIKMTVLDRKVKLNWFKPNSGTAPIETYMSFLYKTMNKSEGIKITMVPFPSCQECVHILDELDRDTLYSVGIRAYNKNGMSDMSNILTFKPQKDMKPKEFLLPEPKPISEIQTKYSFKYCNPKTN